MKKVVGIVAVLMVLVWAGCKKEAAGLSTPKIKTVYCDSSWLYKFDYNADGTLAVIHLVDSADLEYTEAWRWIFQYSTGQVVCGAYRMRQNLPDTTPQLESTIVYQLNTQGLVETVSGPSGFIRNEFTPYRHGTYSYDANSYLTRIDGAVNTINSTISNGNYSASYLACADSSMLSNQYFGQSSATYNLGTTNTIGNDNFGLSFFGTSSTNLVVSSDKSICNNGFCTLSSWKFDYTFDNQGRVIKQTSYVDYLNSVPYPLDTVIRYYTYY